MNRLRGLGLALMLALGALSSAQAQPVMETAPAAVEGRPAPAIMLLTFSPGPVYWQRFGHNALLVRDIANGEDRVYNYGIFDFHQKNFFLNFARGHMQYRLAVEPLADTLAQYQHEGRWVQAQELDLEPAQRRELAAFLAWNARPENADYRYDYFRSNCSTRVRDAIDRAMGGDLKRQMQGKPTGVSYRFEATRLIAPVRPLLLGMDAVMAGGGDAPIDLWQQSFVPMVLMEALRSVRLRDAGGAERPLLRGEASVLDSTLYPEPKRPPALLLPLAGLGLVLAAGLLLLSRLRRHAPARWTLGSLLLLLNLAAGLGGLILLATWFLTDHWVMWRNFNLLLFSPLCLLLLPAAWGQFRALALPGRVGRGVALMVLAGAALALLLPALPGAQQNLHWVALWLPLHAAQAWILARRRA
ncbi:DUF4105 domain-containing protein [Solimonas sp. K1W22B-7]|uniref:Lnb N-terminal periplasmic domain-containing protein n=1 Tax=Solimonas sp. K1W22B-7 TaxID=2303331 RepID=UPI000E32FC9E|nr:DUF4105 domain-containing protein [Solimonas sp. K1W22B-7]AXQ28168.1 DUF4105 domain-containing protein [Solimonas sp. K1W22B-7]